MLLAMNMEFMTEVTAFETVLGLIWRRGHHDQSVPPVEFRSSVLGKNLQRLMAESKKLVFILPAFPAKSPNPLKTAGTLPDLGELIALKNLHELCQEIRLIYPAGAEVLICSDGRVFNDLVLVSDRDLLNYQREIQQMIAEFGLSTLKTFSLDDVWEAEDFSTLRKKLVEEYGQTLDQIQERRKGDPQFQNLFNGIHRFVLEDRRALFPEESRSSLEKKTKQVAAEVIQRSGAWDGLLAETFSDTLRLSIHPYPAGHSKFGIKLVPGGDRWATPWHNVLLRDEKGERLVKKAEAVAAGAVEKKFGGRYVYFQA